MFLFSDLDILSHHSSVHGRLFLKFGNISLKMKSFQQSQLLWNNTKQCILDTLDHLTFNALYFSRIALELSFRVPYI